MSGILTAGWEENQIKAVLKKAVVTKQRRLTGWLCSLGRGYPHLCARKCLHLTRTFLKQVSSVGKSSFTRVNCFTSTFLLCLKGFIYLKRGLLALKNLPESAQQIVVFEHLNPPCLRKHSHCKASHIIAVPLQFLPSSSFWGHNPLLSNAVLWVSCLARGRRVCLLALQSWLARTSYRCCCAVVLCLGQNTHTYAFVCIYTYRCVYTHKNYRKSWQIWKSRMRDQTQVKLVPTPN